MKKNRRGLGRGIEALIQSTAPEDDSVKVEEIEGPAEPQVANDSVQVVESSESASSSTDANPPTGNATPTPTSSASRSTENKPELESQELARDADADASENPHTPDSESDEDSGRGQQRRRDLTSRYLSGRTAASGSTAVPRETRRPVDVFFPDRRAGEEVDLVGADTGHRRPRTRPNMPSLQSASPVKGSPVKGPTSEDVEPAGDQPLTVDEGAHTPAPTSAPASAPTSSRRNPRAAVPERSGEMAEESGRLMGSAGNAELRSVAVADIHPNPRQPRDVFDEDDMEELVSSISQVGVLQPIVVRQVEGPSPYELVMGERRWRASQQAGLTEIPAIVRHTADTDLLRDALLENLHRSQLNPLEEAAAYEQLLEDFNCTQDELSTRIGRSRPQITNTLRLLRLPPLVQRRVASGVLSAGHARALLSLVDPAEMEKLAQKVVSEGLSVRATEELVSLQDGVRQAKPQSRAKRNDRHERLDYLASSLTDRLDTTVKITLGARKGKIAIDFASVDDLNRIMDLMGQSQATSE